MNSVRFFFKVLCLIMMCPYIFFILQVFCVYLFDIYAFWSSIVSPPASCALGILSCVNLESSETQFHTLVRHIPTSCCLVLGPEMDETPHSASGMPCPTRRQEHQCSFWDQTEKTRDRNILSTPWLPLSSFSVFLLTLSGGSQSLTPSLHPIPLVLTRVPSGISSCF